MEFLRSARWLSFTQSGCVLLAGYVQWTIEESVSLTVPMFSMLCAVFVHIMLLRKWRTLPALPADVKQLFLIALMSALIMLVMYCVVQSGSEVRRVAIVLPILWVGLGVMNWVILACLVELVSHLWDSEESSSATSSDGGIPSKRD